MVSSCVSNFCKHSRPFSHMLRSSIVALVRLCCSGTDGMASTRLHALWLIICCHLADSAKKWKPNQGGKIFAIYYFPGSPFFGGEGSPNSESGRHTAIKKRQANCPGEAWNRHKSILWLPKHLQLTGIAYQRISLGSQLAPRIWERTEQVCRKELKNMSKETLLKIN